MEKVRKWSFVLLLALTVSVISAQEASQIKLVTSGKYLAHDSTWFIPLNAGNNRVALFSEQKEGFTILNDSKQKVTIKAIELKPTPGIIQEELTLQKYSIKAEPLQFEETTLQPKQRFEFYVRFYPVQSAPMKAKIEIRFSDASQFVLNIAGQGGANALFPSDKKTVLHKVFGGQKTDEMITAMVADKEGNVFFCGQVIGVQDKYAYDLFYGKITREGNLAWAKLWHGPYRDASRDSGQNDETGGTAGAMGIDKEGFPYLVAACSPAKTNNDFATLILKIDPSSGNPVWEKLWRPEWPQKLLAKHGAEGYAIAIEGDRVFVTGTTGGGIQNAQALVFFLTLAIKDGSILCQKAFDPTPTYNDRGYAIRGDGKGNVYIAGLASQNAFLIQFTQANSSLPKIGWARIIELGWGSSINQIDVDKKGNIYASCDRRGAQTFFSLLKISPQGEILWGKTYNGGPNKNNNCNCIQVLGESVYAGGRTGQSLYDAQMGDALLTKLRLADGAEEWSLFYFSGKGPDEIAEHRVKGLALRGDTLHILGQVYTGNNNGLRYYGYWYQGTGTWSDFKPPVKPFTIKEGLIDMPQGKVIDAASARTLVDLKDLILWQDADKKHDGKSPDGEMIYWQLKLGGPEHWD